MTTTTLGTVISTIATLLEGDNHQGATRDECDQLATVLLRLHEAADIARDRHAIGHGRSRRAVDAVPRAIAKAWTAADLKDTDVTRLGVVVRGEIIPLSPHDARGLLKVIVSQTFTPPKKVEPEWRLFPEAFGNDCRDYLSEV